MLQCNILECPMIMEKILKWLLFALEKAVSFKAGLSLSFFEASWFGLRYIMYVSICDTKVD